MAKRADGSHTSLATEHPAEHQALRTAWEPAVAAGGVECRRAASGQCLADSPLIEPGSPWDLGHPDHVCSAPTAPEHRRCNRSTSTHKAAAKRRPAPTHPAELTRRSNAR